MIRKDKDIIGRSRILKEGKRGDGPVIYWMTRDFRLHDNWSLLFAMQEALLREKPLTILVVFDSTTLKSASPQGSFLLLSLMPFIQEAQDYNIDVALVVGEEEKLIPLFCETSDCHLLITDFLPLRKKKLQCEKIGREINSPLIEVDGHNIIPAWLASEKKEYGAYTLRPKIHRLLPQYLTEFPHLKPLPASSAPLLEIDRFDLHELLNVSGAKEHEIHHSGHEAGKKTMVQFIDHGLDNYDLLRNDPTVDGQSNLSPYLHFGLLSAQRLALQVSKAKVNEESKKSYLEELIVRRELADNFCLYEPGYDTFSGFHPWAQKSLNEHRKDKRKFCYSKEEFENCSTHEPLWNSCQYALMKHNKLHGFLRMYWAKKILEWSGSPEDALAIAIYLNDKFSLDGNDPNGYTGIAWSIGGVHDRAWQEREIFGKVRYMNERGCRRKFDVEKYIAEYSPH